MSVPRPLNPTGERGVALVLALMALLLLSALGAGLVLTTSTETMITANYRDGAEAMYAADAGIERVLPDLLDADAWNSVLAGATRSGFVDGPPSGTRDLPSGGSIDLTRATNMLNCGKAAACSAEEMDAHTAERPWARNNPRWQLYAYGPLASLLDGGDIVSNMYVVVWVADDPSENDDDPAVDGTTEDNPGSGQVSLRAEAFGAGGVRRAVEVTVSRTDIAELQGGYTGQRGQGERNQRAQGAGVNLGVRSSIGGQP